MENKNYEQSQQLRLEALKRTLSIGYCVGDRTVWRETGLRLFRLLDEDVGIVLENGFNSLVLP